MHINDYFFEVDRNPICIALHLYLEESKAEIACVRRPKLRKGHRLAHGFAEIMPGCWASSNFLSFDASGQHFVKRRFPPGPAGRLADAAANATTDQEGTRASCSRNWRAAVNRTHERPVDSPCSISRHLLNSLSLLQRWARMRPGMPTKHARTR